MQDNQDKKTSTDESTEYIKIQNKPQREAKYFSFLQIIQICSGAWQAPYSMGAISFFLPGLGDRDVKFTTQTHPRLRIRINGAVADSSGRAA